MEDWASGNPGGVHCVNSLKWPSTKTEDKCDRGRSQRTGWRRSVCVCGWMCEDEVARERNLKAHVSSVKNFLITVRRCHPDGMLVGSCGKSCTFDPCCVFTVTH